MYNQLVNAFIDAQTAAWRSYYALARIEDQTLGAVSTGRRAIRVPTTDATMAELRHVYNAVVDRIIEKTKRKYATPTATPAISLAFVCGLAGIDIERSLAEGTVPDFDHLGELLDMQLRRVTDKGGER
jgi:hypothetical protein